MIRSRQCSFPWITPGWSLAEEGLLSSSDVRIVPGDVLVVRRQVWVNLPLAKTNPLEVWSSILLEPNEVMTVVSAYYDYFDDVHGHRVIPDRLVKMEVMVRGALGIVVITSLYDITHYVGVLGEGGGIDG